MRNWELFSPISRSAASAMSSKNRRAAFPACSVRAANDYLGVYALDTLDLTDQLTVTAGARFNRAGIALYDLRGTTLNGNGIFTRINPSRA